MSAVKPLLALQNDLIRRQVTDCTFSFDEDSQTKTIEAHKNVLALSSPVFHAMFYGELKETSDVKITDISFNTFQQLVSIIYGKIVILFTHTTACQLYYAAKKYDVSEALIIARNFMTDKMTSENAGEIYVTATLFNDSEISRQCFETFVPAIYDTTKTKNFFESTKPLEKTSGNTFATKQIAENSPIKQALDDKVKKIKGIPNLEEQIDHSLGLIRYLTKTVNEIFEIYIPKSTAMMSFSLNMVHRMKTIQDISELFMNVNMKKISCPTCKRPATRRENYTISCDYCGLRTYAKMLKKFPPMIQKYNSQDLFSYNFEDIKSIYEEF